MTDVTINGQTVDSIDAAGNYFGFVTITAGTQSYEVIATNIFGGTATTAIAIGVAITFGFGEKRCRKNLPLSARDFRNGR